MVSTELADLYLKPFRTTTRWALGVLRRSTQRGIRSMTALSRSSIGVCVSRGFNANLTRLASAQSSLSPTDVADPSDWFVRQQRESIVSTPTQVDASARTRPLSPGSLWKSVPCSQRSPSSNATCRRRPTFFDGGSRSAAGDVSLAKPSKLCDAAASCAPTRHESFGAAPNLSEDISRRPRALEATR